MGGEQRAGLVVDRIQILDHRPGDGEPVEGGRPATDLVQDDQRTLPRLIEDGRGFHHLHHESGAPAREIVRRTDAAEQAVHRADMCVSAGT